MARPHLSHVAAIAAAAWCLLGGPVHAGDVPRAIQAFREARAQIQSGRVDWTVTLPDQGRTIRYVSRYARNGDLIFENRGDEEGWVSGSSKFPHLYLRNKDGVWRYLETAANATVCPPGTPEQHWSSFIKDVRTLGVFSTSKSLEEPLEARAAWESESDPVVSYEQRRSGDTVVVAGTHQSGSKTEWTLAPDKGWNATRIVSESPNGVRTEVDNVLRQFGDTWFPYETTYRRNGEVEAIVRVQNAQVNLPGDPRRFGPPDIGIEAGIQLSTNQIGARVKFWNGEAIISDVEYARQEQMGLVTPGPIRRQLLEKGYFDSPYLTPKDRQVRTLHSVKVQADVSARAHEGLWRDYVDRFIKRYNLNADQRQKAELILADCQEAAEAILRRTESRWREVQAQLDQARADRNQDELSRVNTEMSRLQEPITVLFERRLVPRLDAIPTRAQRAAAERAEKDKKAESGGKPDEP